MDDLLSPKNNKLQVENAANEEQTSQFSSRGLYIREDDQDWGSAGMNDIQKDFE